MATGITFSQPYPSTTLYYNGYWHHLRSALPVYNFVLQWLLASPSLSPTRLQLCTAMATGITFAQTYPSTTLYYNGYWHHLLSALPVYNSVLQWLLASPFLSPTRLQLCTTMATGITFTQPYPSTTLYYNGYWHHLLSALPVYNSVLQWLLASPSLSPTRLQLCTTMATGITFSQPYPSTTLYYNGYWHHLLSALPVYNSVLQWLLASPSLSPTLLQPCTTMATGITFSQPYPSTTLYYNGYWHHLRSALPVYNSVLQWLLASPSLSPTLLQLCTTMATGITFAQPYPSTTLYYNGYWHHLRSALPVYNSVLQWLLASPSLSPTRLQLCTTMATGITFSQPYPSTTLYYNGYWHQLRSALPFYNSVLQPLLARFSLVHPLSCLYSHYGMLIRRLFLSFLHTCPYQRTLSAFSIHVHTNGHYQLSPYMSIPTDTISFLHTCPYQRTLLAFSIHVHTNGHY